MLRQKADEMGVDLLVGGSILDDCINNGFWWMRPTEVMKQWFLKFAAYVYRHPEGCHQKLMSALLGENKPYKRKPERWTLPFLESRSVFQFFRYFENEELHIGDEMNGRKDNDNGKQLIAEAGQEDSPPGFELLRSMTKFMQKDAEASGHGVIPPWAPLDPEKIWGHAFHFDERVGVESSLYAFHFEAGGWVENTELVKNNDKFREELLDQSSAATEGENGGAPNGAPVAETETQLPGGNIKSGEEFEFFYGPTGPPHAATIQRFLRTRRIPGLPKKLKVCNQSGRFAYSEEEDSAAGTAGGGGTSSVDASEGSTKDPGRTGL
ncbi:unnamed protein product [Amoebophrya sp. A25]|nr:unnamed protein product [Amoebophrya sp. A25]|eukprot:GSA25T00005174001.1